MRDLTVDSTHTYYVIAGDHPVLVHNCGARAVDMFGREISNPDDLTRGLLEHANTALGELDKGKLLGWADRLRIKLKPSRKNTIVGRLLDRRVKELVDGDLNLRDLFSTPNGMPGPDWINTGRRGPNIGWFDLTTASEWGQHVFDYAPRFGPGIGILWR